MEFKKVVEDRRSIRNYKDIEIEYNIVEEIIECARLAPSAKNRQPWLYVIVDKETKNKIADIMLDEQIEYDSKGTNNIFRRSVKKSADIIKEAPVFILVFNTCDKNSVSNILSIGAAIEHILLKATDMGLGSLWIRDIVFTKDKIAKLVEHKNFDLVSAITIGYASNEVKARPRKELKEIIEWK